MFACTPPDSPARQVRHLFGLAVRAADHAIRPAQIDHSTLAILKIAEVDNRFLKGVRRHDHNLANAIGTVKYIIALIRTLCGDLVGTTVEIDIHEAAKLMELCYQNLEFDDPDDEQARSQIAMLEHFSQQADPGRGRGKVCLITADDRKVKRYRPSGRFSDAPDTKQQEAAAKAVDTPVLMLLRQNAKEEDGWRGLPFWWPVVVTPQNSITSVFAAETPRKN
jgi:hypothetical protein